MPSPYFFQSFEGGEGGGSGGINYLEDYFAGDDITGINTYNDGASATPVDGTGGSVTGLTTAVNTSSPLGEASDIKFSKDAANRQGMGWSTDFEVQRADYSGSKPLIETFVYKTSANYASGDLRVFAYDKDNGTLLNVLSLTGDGSINYSADGAGYTGSFSLVSTANSYRLIFHITSTNASAWDFNFVRLSASPEQTVPGAIQYPIGPEAWADNQANATTTVSGMRDGIWFKGKFKTTYTGAQSGAFTIAIPTEYTPSSTIYPSGTTIVYSLSRCDLVDVGSGVTGGFVYFDPATGLLNVTTGTTYGGLTATSPFTWASGDKIEFQAEWIVSGWAASAALSTTETMMMGATAKASGNPASAADGAPIIWPTENWDNLSAYSTSTGQFTAPRTGKYIVKGFISGATAARTVFAYVNAVQGPQVCQLDSNGQAAFSVTVEANSGQTIDIRPVGGALDVTSGSIYFEEWFNPTVFSVYGTTALYPATGYSSGGLVNYTITAGQYGDLDSEVLQPGEYDLFANAQYHSNGATTTTNVMLGVSTTSGNSATGLVEGDTTNFVVKDTASASRNQVTVMVPGIVVTTPTTYYLKGLANTSITNLQIAWSWRFRAVKRGG